jgi:soluble lytic murein transglycosylase
MSWWRGAATALAGAALASLALLTWPQAAAGDDYTAVRQEFSAAYARAEAGGGPPEAGDSAALVAYPLYPHLQAARIRAALAAAPASPTPIPVDKIASELLAAHRDDPVGRILRRAWLPSLAQRRQWRAVLEVYAQAGSPDQTLRCQAISARIALNETAGLADAAVAEWLTPKSAADACDPAFAWLKAQGLLDAALIERRARLALAEGETGLAKWLAKSLEPARARPLRDWALLIDSPQAAIDAAIASPSAAIEDAALLDGWSRLARRNPQAAIDRFDALVKSRRLDAAKASPYARELALGLAWSRRPKALDYFAKVAAVDFSDAAYEWQVRAAIWAGDWARAAQGIDAMPVALAADTRWRYWAARAQEALGHADRAQEMYAALTPTDNWFAVLAAARLGQRFAPSPQPIAYDAESVEALERSLPFLRARELLLSDLPALAQAEWNAAYGALDSSSRSAAVIMASRWGWHFQAIASAAQLGVFDDYALLYPRPFDRPVAEGAKLSGLSRTLIYAVIRQESLYQPWAISGAGAIGLMQLLPSTARQTAAVMDRPRPTREALTRPEINVPLGAAFLARLVERFDGQVVLALASYNAGPGAARRWLPDSAMDVDVWVENIPYNETRVYVQRIMWYSVVFKWLEDGQPEDASSWLERIKPVYQ